MDTRKIVADELRQVADQVEAGHLVAFLVRWEEASAEMVSTVVPRKSIQYVKVEGTVKP